MIVGNKKSMQNSSSHFSLYLEQQRFALSVILSFLDENDGTCVLITNKTLLRLLPVFRIPPHLIKEDAASVQTDINARRLKKLRHIYKPLPIQCASVLLDRLNAERLSKRMRRSETKYPYLFNMTTEEIAWFEWIHERNQFVSYQEKDATYALAMQKISQHSPKLELLRYRSPPPQSKSIYNFKLSIPPNISNSILAPKILPGATVLASYPRSGNTLLRTLLERTTGIITGSDTRPDRTLSKALSTIHSLVGEGITSHLKTPVIKTHFPERRGFMMYNASRIILLVRNPYDAIDSYWNMCCTNTHTESVSEEVYDRYRGKFRELAHAEMGTWSSFLKYWLLNCNTTLIEKDLDRESLSNCNKKKNVGPPILLIRFEDLVQDTASIMERVIKFITVDDPYGTVDIHPFWKWRIHRALGLEHTNLTSTDKSVDTTNLGSYKPRSYQNGESRGTAKSTKESKNGNSFGKSLKKNRYTEKDLLRMHEIAAESNLHHPTVGDVNFCKMLGYDVFQQKFPANLGTKENECNWCFIYPRGNGDCRRSTIRLNLGPELRPTNSPFGRAMTRWRKSQTCDDTEPFDIIEKKR